MGQPVESNSFIFGPGEWKLSYNPPMTSEWNLRYNPPTTSNSQTNDQNLQFTLKYLGKLESNNTGDDGTADPAVFIKLALLSRTGSELEFLS